MREILLHSATFSISPPSYLEAPSTGRVKEENLLPTIAVSVRVAVPPNGIAGDPTLADKDRVRRRSGHRYPRKAVKVALSHMVKTEPVCSEQTGNIGGISAVGTLVSRAKARQGPNCVASTAGVFSVVLPMSQLHIGDVSEGMGMAKGGIHSTSIAILDETLGIVIGGYSQT